jgi:hypothetical protein
MNNFQYIDKLRLTTPKATLKYPKLIEPETKFSPEGHYKVTAVIPAEDAAELADQLDALYEAHKAEPQGSGPNPEVQGHRAKLWVRGHRRQALLHHQREDESQGHGP